MTGDFQAAPTSEHQKQCDASHIRFRGTFEGTQTSSDPRLAGKLKVRVVSIVNTANGYGRTRARVRVTDPATGRPKFKGHAIGVLEPGGGAEGFLDGRTTGPGSVRLLANFNAQQNESTGALTGEFGKDTLSGATKDPAILTNACRGGRHGEHGNDARRGGKGGHGRRHDG